MAAKATKAAMKLAAMYGLDLERMPHDQSVPHERRQVTVEDVRRYLKTIGGGKLSPSAKPESPVPEAPGVPGDSGLPLPPDSGDFQDGQSVMVKGKFLGTVVGPGPEIASDGKKLWRVKSPSHPPDVETVAYAAEDLTKVLG